MGTIEERLLREAEALDRAYAEADAFDAAQGPCCPCENDDDLDCACGCHAGETDDPRQNGWVGSDGLP